MSTETKPKHDPDLYPFRGYCRDNNIGVSTGYRLVKANRLKLTHIGKRSYLTRKSREDFLKSLENDT
jgi:hypothetical protein